jgi:hypothetical protein
MSARKGPSNKEQRTTITSNSGRNPAGTSIARSDSSGLLPRKRARLSTTAMNEAVIDDSDSSSSSRSLSSSSDSEESTKMVAAFIGEDSQERLRLKAKEEEKEGTKKAPLIGT